MTPKPIDNEALDAITEICINVIIAELLKPENESVVIGMMGDMLMGADMLTCYDKIKTVRSDLTQKFEECYKAAFTSVLTDRLLKALNSQGVTT